MKIKVESEIGREPLFLFIYLLSSDIIKKVKKLKVFGVGFVKGLVLLLLIMIIFNLIKHLFLQEPKDWLSYKTLILLEITGLLTVGYIVKRYKQPRVWMLPTIFLTFYILPFLFGAIEYKKKFK